jgi:hypothetical protein
VQRLGRRQGRSRDGEANQILVKGVVTDRRPALLAEVFLIAGELVLVLENVGDALEIQTPHTGGGRHVLETLLDVTMGSYQLQRTTVVSGKHVTILDHIV